MFVCVALISNSKGQTLAPLAVGNVWVYQESENSAQRVKYYLSDTVTIGGNIYYACKQNNSDSVAIHFRLLDDGVYVRKMYGVDYPYYKANFSMVDTISYRQWYGTWRFIMTAEAIENIFGKEVTCKSISANMIFMNNNEKWTDEFGLISGINSTGNGYHILKGCVVNGVLYGDTSMVVTNINDDKLVTGFILEQNYPNPFNPETVISFSIPAASNVQLKIYDVLGKEVSTLVNEYKQPGKYSINYSAKNNELASGIYFYSLSANNFYMTKKLLYLK